MGRRAERGYTLLELLVTISIILLLMGILLPTLAYFIKQKKITGTVAKIHALRIALEQYHTTWGVYPIRPGGSGNFSDSGSGSFDPGFYHMTCAPQGSAATGSEDNSPLIKVLRSTGDIDGIKQSDLKNGCLIDNFGAPIIVRFVVASVVSPGGNKPMDKVMIWSYGPNGVNDTRAQPTFSNQGLPNYDAAEIDAMKSSTNTDEIFDW